MLNYVLFYKQGINYAETSSIAKYSFYSLDCCRLFEIHRLVQYPLCPPLLAHSLNPLFLIYLLPNESIPLGWDIKVFYSQSNLGAD